MGGEGVHGGGAGREAVDVFGLVAVEPVEHVVCLGFDGVEDGAVADGGVGAEEGEVVGEGGGGDAEVGLGVGGPEGLEVGAGVVGDGEAGYEGGVEACSADEDVGRVGGGVGAVEGCGGDVGDGGEDDGDVGLGEGFEVAGAWGQAAAADGPFGDEVVGEGWVVEFLFHLVRHVCLDGFVQVGLVEEGGESAVEATFYHLAVFEKGAGGFLEVGALLWGVDVLFESLSRRYPGRIADECCQLLDDWLNGWYDLNA